MLKLNKVGWKESEDLRIIKEHYGIKTNAKAMRKALELTAHQARVERDLIKRLKEESNDKL
jgi:hypothetical protein